jgi:hypothetical protein
MLAWGSYILRKHHMYPIFSSLHHGSDPDLRCQPTGRYAFCWSGTLLGLYLLLEWEALSTGSGVGPVDNLWLIMFCATFANISQITWANNMFIVPNIYILYIYIIFLLLKKDCICKTLVMVDWSTCFDRSGYGGSHGPGALHCEVSEWKLWLGAIGCNLAEHCSLERLDGELIVGSVKNCIDI